MNLIPVDEALRRILDGVVPLPSEDVTLNAAFGRTLAQDLPALRQQPPFPASAMDGYAVRAADATVKGARLTLVGEAVAGRGFQGRVEAGETVRIFTGAPVPNGADSILIQENALRDGAAVDVLEPVEPGRFVRRAGLDFDRGTVLLKKGDALDYRHAALAASMGYASVPAIRQPLIAVAPTGDELVLPGTEPGPDQIVASNQVGVCALAEANDGRSLDLGIAGDNLDALSAKIEAARDAGADVLVTLGGASVGDHDLVQEALARHGMTLDFWRIAMRPGKPLMFGYLEGMRVLGLPGNPVSSLVCSKLFLVPLILALLGRATGSALRTVRARLAEPLPANDRRQDYVRAKLSKDASGEPVIAPFSLQDSSMLELFTHSDALIVRAPFAEALAEGAYVDYLPLP